MRKFYLVVFTVLSLGLPIYAQQLPDPHFEDWSGAQFDDQIQPKYWNYSNVEQLGVKKNFAHRETGRSGYCLLIQDQFVGVGSIGATSPGYVALGHPWAYVSSLTAINDATAGTYGGLQWTYRPDSIVVWIKRTGPKTADENFNILYYAWTGTSQGAAYKAKDGSCTNISSSKPAYCVDEESDIRIALDANECTTKTPGTQIAEGWWYERRTYADWTQLRIPIYYFSDQVPEKCNIILSAGNYPNFRANDGLYDGNNLYVDDISLVYSSHVQKLFINGREWNAFDPNNTSTPQICSLGKGVTTVPDIYAVRGAGSLTSPHGTKATFAGRRLTDSECTVVKGSVDGDPTLITVRAEDGSSTSTYTIQFVSQASDNALLSNIQLDGQDLVDFNAYLTSYQVALPYGTTTVPTLTATAQEPTSTVEITQATSPTGKATIVVTAPNGTTKKTYQVQFSVSPLTDLTLVSILVDGVTIADYLPSRSNYSISLPLGTTKVPTITWQSAYPAGQQVVKILSNTLDGGCQIQVSIPGLTATKTYRITYRIEASACATLNGIALNGEPLTDFASSQTNYTINLPLGTTQLPTITWTPGDAYQTIRLIEGGVDGLTKIEVQAAAGNTTTYRLNFQTEKSSNTQLQALVIDGDTLAEFQPDVLTYTITLPAGTTRLPAVSWLAGDAYQTIVLSESQTLWLQRITVKASDGSQQVYTIHYELQKSEDAYLRMIYLDGDSLDGFVPEQLDYAVAWSSPVLPKLTVEQSPDQKVSILMPSSFGTAQIVVTPEQGTANRYTIRFYSTSDPTLPDCPDLLVTDSSNAQLSTIYLGNQVLNHWNANTCFYTDTLDHGSLCVPCVVPVPATLGQTIRVEQGRVGDTTWVYVSSPNNQVHQTYAIYFPVRRSANTRLASVEIDGVDFTFRPEQRDYLVTLPYGSTQTPAIRFEKAEKAQEVILTEAPLERPSTLRVMAEDSTTGVYTIRFEVQPSDLPNRLNTIVVNGVGALDLSQGPNISVELPFGTRVAEVVSYQKAFAEQEVIIQQGVAGQPTTLTVHSGRKDDPDYIYRLTPTAYYDPAALLDIQVDGVSIPHFLPTVYTYVMSVTSEPQSVQVRAAEGATVYLVDSTYKSVSWDVELGAYAHRYTLTFYYPGDLTFDTSFEQWNAYTNDATSKSGSVPNGWFTPLNTLITDDKGSFDPSENVKASSSFTNGSRSASLNTTYLLTSAESMPGFLSLSRPTLAIGAWGLGIVVNHSTLTFSGKPITFRNTPDVVQLDYQLQSYNKVEGWRFVYKPNGSKKVDYAQSFASMSANQWATLSQPLTYSNDFVPSTLDILISAAQSDVLEDYYVGANGAQKKKRFTSSMLVDNLRLQYNSRLASITVDGEVCTIPSTGTIVRQLPADYSELPLVVCKGEVVDQMPVMEWSEEVNRTRTLTIRNYAEDLSFTEYKMSFRRALSTTTSCEAYLQGADLIVKPVSPYQKIRVSKCDTAYVVLVQAESGAKQEYIVLRNLPAVGLDKVDTTYAEMVDTPVPGQSTSHLLEVRMDDNHLLYFEQEYALDTIQTCLTDTLYTICVKGCTDATTYTLPTHLSGNSLLRDILINGVSLKEFDEQTTQYSIQLSSLDSVRAIPQDSRARVETQIIPQDATHQAIFCTVLSENGQQQTCYGIEALVTPLQSTALLQSIVLDSVLLTGFLPTKTDYTVQLPHGSNIPLLYATAADNATVTTSIQSLDNGQQVTYEVTSQDGATHTTYTVQITIAPSSDNALQMIYLDEQSLADFHADSLRYDIILPYGTTSLPAVTYLLSDPTAKVVTTTQAEQTQLLVTAEDGSIRTYVLHFTVALSSNALLSAIALDEQPVAQFYSEDTAYTFDLPYGASLPLVTATTADTDAHYQLSWQGDTCSILVTAPDGVTHQTYTLQFNYLPSTNSHLAMIYLDGVEQRDYTDSVFEYLDTVLLNQPMPEITWLLADPQQTVDTTWQSDVLTITVTAGNMDYVSDYTLTFVHQLSSNTRLSDIRIDQQSIPSFHVDSTEYHLIYPIGTKESELITPAQLDVLTEDSLATVDISESQHTIQILVTAQDGTMTVYIIHQQIMLSSEARIAIIYLDSTELLHFDPDTYSYDVLLRQGSAVPSITAIPYDTLAHIEQGLLIDSLFEDGMGKYIELDGVAQDGTRITYSLSFHYAAWVPTSDIQTDDYLFQPVAGTDQYMALTTGVGVQLGIYDLTGRVHFFGDVPTAEPYEVEVEIDESGNSRLVAPTLDAEGLRVTVPANQILFYVFFDSKTHRIAKGGKIFRL